MKKLNLEEKFFTFLMFLSAIIISAVFILLLVVIFVKAMPALSFDMITKTPSGGSYSGSSGGILNAILGSIYLSIGAVFISFIISLPTALYINFYLKKTKIRDTIRIILDVMWGIPSIVYGAFGFIVMVNFGIRSSLLAGMITVAIFITPIMIRAMDEIFITVPRGLYESAISLGALRGEISFKVMTRQCMAGIVSAILLSFGRGIGDAASVLFTAGYSDHIATSLNQPTATLPLAVFFQAGSPFPEVRQKAYAAAAILTIIILIISISTRFLLKKYSHHKIKL